MAAEQRLAGGNVGADVVRVGATVRKPAGPWSASVDALLLQLEAVGYPAAPRALGYDGEGRQVLSYVEGVVDPSPADLDGRQLRRVGRLIREFHDAVASFTPPASAVWNVAIRPDAENIICHHDLAPWNLVRGAALVFIDWDGAGPGTRLWDLAYALHGFVPLSPEAGLEDGAVAERLASLVDGYGLGGPERRRLPALVARRTWSMHELLADGHRRGRQPWARLWEEGHGEAWAADARYTERCRPLLESVLGP